MEDDVDNWLCDKLIIGVRDVVEFDFSMYVLFEDNLDKIEDEGDKELESV